MIYLQKLITRLFLKFKNNIDVSNSKPLETVLKNTKRDSSNNITFEINKKEKTQIDKIGYYPILINSDQKQSLNFSNSILKRRVGVSEKKFFSYLYKEFRLNVFNTIIVEKNGIKYEPDIAFIDEEKGIYIDIEIDEPYSINNEYGLISTHVKGTDDTRNTFFQKNGWSVIRFSEKQVVKYPKECINVIKRFIIELPIRNDFRDETWSKEKSEIMIKNKYRDTYLPQPLSSINYNITISYPTIFLTIKGIKNSKNTDNLCIYFATPFPYFNKLKLFITKKEFVSAYNTSEIKEFPNEKTSLNEFSNQHIPNKIYDNLIGSYIEVTPFNIRDGWINASKINIIIREETLNIIKKVQDLL